MEQQSNRAKHTGLSGFVALAFGLHRLSAVELLSFANVCATQGYPGVAAVALDEMRRRAA